MLRPKVDGALNLHELTQRHGAVRLRVVLLGGGRDRQSGAGQLRGGERVPGCAGAATAALGAWRAHSLAWGLWEQASGMTSALDQAGVARLERSGCSRCSAEHGLELFDAAAAPTGRCSSRRALDLAALRAQARAGRAAGAAAAAWCAMPRAARAAAADRWRGGLPACREEEWEALVLELVRGQAAAVLGHGSADGGRSAAAFKDLGFDSLGAVELRNRLDAGRPACGCPRRWCSTTPPQGGREMLLAQVDGAQGAARGGAPGGGGG